MIIVWSKFRHVNNILCFMFYEILTSVFMFNIIQVHCERLVSRRMVDGPEELINSSIPDSSFLFQ